MYSNQQDGASPSGNGQTREMSNQEFIAAIGLIAAVLAAANLYRLKNFYYLHYDAIHYWGVGIVAALIFGLAWLIMKKTKVLKKRYINLKPLTKPLEAIFAGTTTDGIKLHIPDQTRTGHVQIIGATGRGKTESVILPWLTRDILAGKNSILIDGKGDAELAAKIKKFAKDHKPGCDVCIFDLADPDKSVTVNPLQYGSPQQITDRIFTAFEFKDPFYKAVQYDVCRDLVQLIRCGLYEDVSFKRIYELLTDDDALAAAISKCEDKELVKRLTRFLFEPKTEREKKLKGLESQLAPFAVGEVSLLVNGPVDGKGFCSISNTIITNALQRVFVILIPTLKYQEIGHKLGKIFCQELGWTIGERDSLNYPKEFRSVYLDEFSAFVYDGFANILNKARSAQVGLHLSHQSLGDLESVSPEFAKTVNTNTNIKCLLGLNDPDTADFFARHIGTSTEEKTTERAKAPFWFGKADRTGDLSIREVEAYKIHPNSLKNFTAGQGVIHLPTTSGNVTEEIQFARIGDE